MFQKVNEKEEAVRIFQCYESTNPINDVRVSESIACFRLDIWAAYIVEDRNSHLRKVKWN